MVKKILRYHYLIYMGLLFVVFDLYIRYINLDINFGSIYALTANFFTASWIFLFLGIILFFNKTTKKIFYSLIAFIAIIIFIVNTTYYRIFNSFFTFKNLEMAEEGSVYLNSIFMFFTQNFVIVLLLGLILFCLGFKFIPKQDIKSDKIMAILMLIMASFSFMMARNFLGEPADKLAWDAWNYKRNIYDTFMESRKSLQVTGLYEYVIRDIYFTYFKKSESDEGIVEYLDNYFSHQFYEKEDNEWTGIFEDKNIVLIMMESIDNWLVTEEIMPNLNRLMNEGINFTNHFSPIYGGGATFNSEFVVNTGYMTPFNGGSAAYMYSNNNFPYSLPNLFKNKGYSANVFHLNYGAFYNREIMSKVFGYDNYYGSYDLGIPREEAMKDSHFMTNKMLKDLIFPNEKFLSSIMTYSVHLPYNKNAMECSINLTEEERLIIDEDEEIICIKAQARETDVFFKLLINELINKDLIDNTVIIGYTDHYAYGFLDKNKLFEFKNISDYNFIHQTPFFIWSNDIVAVEIDKVSSTIDIFPTIANLFNLNYKPYHYLGKNILNDLDNGFVFFQDYSWYDGKTYYKNNNIKFGDKVDQIYISNMNKRINEILKVNKGVLETNYFNK